MGFAVMCKFNRVHLARVHYLGIILLREILLLLNLDIVPQAHDCVNRAIHLGMTRAFVAAALV